MLHHQILSKLVSVLLFHIWLIHKKNNADFKNKNPDFFFQSVRKGDFSSSVSAFSWGSPESPEACQVWPGHLQVTALRCPPLPLLWFPDSSSLVWSVLGSQLRCFSAPPPTPPFLPRAHFSHTSAGILPLLSSFQRPLAHSG